MALKFLNNLNTPIFTTILVYVLSFLCTMVFSHILGAELMGEYYLFLAYYTFFMFLSGNTMEYIVANVTDKNNVDSVTYSVSFILRMLMTLITVIVILLFQPPHADWLILVVLIGVCVGTIVSGLHAENRIGMKFIITTTSDVVKLVMQVILVVLGFSIGGMFCAVVLGAMSSLVLALTMKNLRVDFHITWNAFKENCKKLLPFYLALALYLGAYMIVYSCTPILLSFFCESAEIGQFRSAWNIAAVGALFIVAVTPIIIRQGKEMNKEKLSSMLTLCCLCTAPIVFGGIALSEWLLYFCFGSDFSAGYVCLVILLAFKLVENVGEICLATVMYAYSRRAGTIIMCISCLIMIISNLILIPLLGIEGSCIAHILCALIIVIVSAFVVRKQLRITVDMFKIVGCGLIMGAVVFGLSMILPKSLLVCVCLVAVGGLVYVGLIRLLSWKSVKKSYNLISKL